MSRKQHFSAQSASDEATVVISCGPLGPGFQFWPVCLPLQVQGLGLVLVLVLLVLLVLMVLVVAVVVLLLLLQLLPRSDRISS